MLGRFLLFGSLLSVCLSVAGCGEKNEATHAVHGIVRFPDGKLLREGTVEFEIMGREKPMPATSEIGPDGSFQLGTFTLDDGAVAGKHRVVVICDQLIGNGAERPGMLAQQKLHPKYRSYRTSKLIFEVKEGRNDIAIEVEYAPVETEDDQPPTS